MFWQPTWTHDWLLQSVFLLICGNIWRANQKTSLQCSFVVGRVHVLHVFGSEMYSTSAAPSKGNWMEHCPGGQRQINAKASYDVQYLRTLYGRLHTDTLLVTFGTNADLKVCGLCL